MNNTFLNDNQIDLMADAAVTNYELTADWSDALRVAIEYSIDELVSSLENRLHYWLSRLLKQNGWLLVMLLNVRWCSEYRK